MTFRSQICICYEYVGAEVRPLNKQIPLTKRTATLLLILDPRKVSPPSMRPRIVHVILKIVAGGLAGTAFFALCCAFTQPAYAYVDPGSGLLALQMIGSTTAGILFFVRKRLLRFVKGLHRPEEEKQAARNDTGRPEGSGSSESKI